MLISSKAASLSNVDIDEAVVVVDSEKTPELLRSSSVRTCRRKTLEGDSISQSLFRRRLGAFVGFMKSGNKVARKA